MLIVVGLAVFFIKQTGFSDGEANILNTILLPIDSSSIETITKEEFDTHYFQRSDERDVAIDFFTNTTRGGFIDVEQAIWGVKGQGAGYKAYYNSKSDNPQKFLFGLNTSNNSSLVEFLRVPPMRWQLQPFGYVYDSRLKQISALPPAPWALGYRCDMLSGMSGSNGCYKGVEPLYFDEDTIIVNLSKNSSVYPEALHGIYKRENNSWVRLTEKIDAATVLSDGCTLLFEIKSTFRPTPATIKENSIYKKVDICEI